VGTRAADQNGEEAGGGAGADYAKKETGTIAVTARGSAKKNRRWNRRSKAKARGKKKGRRKRASPFEAGEGVKRALPSI